MIIEDVIMMMALLEKSRPSRISCERQDWEGNFKYIETNEKKPNGGIKHFAMKVGVSEKLG